MAQKLLHSLFIVIILLQYTLSTKADCVHDSRQPHTGNCEHYFQCVYGTLYELSCPNGFHFNADTETCESPESANCKIVEPCVEDDLLPHPDNCQLFYKCFEGSLSPISCPDGLHFNADEKICDWPEHAKCEITEERCVDGDLSSYPDDCRMFYKCFGGVFQVLNCPDGLHFNANEGQCDWPEQAKCEAFEERCIDGDMSPFPNDCQLFYKCSGGSLEVLSCPDGLHFNANEKECDWPEQAKCEVFEERCVDGALSPHPEDCQLFFKCSAGSFEVLSCPDGLHFNANEGQCDWPVRAECEISEEKCIDDELFPHTERCELFYQCSGGALLLQSCPQGLQFNPIEKVCDFPERAQCAIEEEKCVDGDAQPHSEACNLFYLCTQGRFVTITCPEGLYFDPNQKRCDFPENVSCVQN